jgi:hypothetical protein
MAGDDAVYYTLGQNAPYFSYMKMTDDRANKSGYINLAFLVANSEFIIGGEKVTPNFVLADLGGSLSISLDYGDYNKLNFELESLDAIIDKCDFADKVNLEFAVRSAVKDRILKKISEFSAGRLEALALGTRFDFKK